MIKEIQTQQTLRSELAILDELLNADRAKLDTIADNIEILRQEQFQARAIMAEHYDRHNQLVNMLANEE